jgi:hypothetical protein
MTHRSDTTGDVAAAEAERTERDVGSAGDRDSPSSHGDSPSGVGDGGSSDRGRDVVVPMPLYKVVTVFSTLIAVVCVVFGFMLLDAATLNVSVLGNAIRGVLAFVGLAVDDGILRPFLATVGLAIIAFGAGVYVIGTRFRAPGMGNSQEDSDEASNNNG